MCMAILLIYIYTPMKFHVDILYSFWEKALKSFVADRLKEWQTYGLTDGQTKPILYPSAFGGAYKKCVS